MRFEHVQAVIFDLSGTVIDHGSRGPVLAFVEMFRRQGLAVSEAEARKPMGAHKWDHIMAVLTDEVVLPRWVALKGAPPRKEDVDAMYPEFTQIQSEMLLEHVDVLPGVREMCAELRARGLDYASTTGFDTTMMGAVKASALAGGFEPRIFLCPDMVGGGRPAPWMIYRAAKEMGRYPLHRFVKVGDTQIDIEEARAAGCWAVSVVETGNEVGLSREELEGLAAGEREGICGAARERFLRWGAHYTVARSADLLPVLEEIEERLGRGERP